MGEIMNEINIGHVSNVLNAPVVIVNHKVGSSCKILSFTALNNTFTLSINRENNFLNSEIIGEYSTDVEAVLAYNNVNLKDA